MIRQRRALLVFMVLGASFCSAAEKKREWQTGTIRDTGEESVFGGYSSTTNKIYDTTVTSTKANNFVYATVLIVGNKYSYEVTKSLKWRWSKGPTVTVNAPVKFAVDEKRHKLYLIDDDGKEHETAIKRRVLLIPSGQPSNVDDGEKQALAVIQQFAAEHPNFNAVQNRMLELLKAPGALGDMSQMSQREKLQAAYDIATKEAATRGKK